MGKQKKKRNKVYAGANASITRPTITRLKAENRSAIKQWWLEKRRIAKPVLIVTAIGFVVIWLLVELVRIVTRGIA